MDDSETREESEKETEMNEQKIFDEECDEEPCPQCNGTGMYLTDVQARYGDEPQPCSMCHEVER